MQPIEFCYWLQGFIEIQDPGEISYKQVDIIKEHLKLVFSKVTPDRSTLNTYPSVCGGNILTNAISDQHCVTKKLCDNNDKAIWTCLDGISCGT